MCRKVRENMMSHLIKAFPPNNVIGPSLNSYFFITPHLLLCVGLYQVTYKPIYAHISSPTGKYAKLCKEIQALPL